MTALFYALVLVLVAGSVHVVSLLALPHLATNDAYSRLDRISGENTMTLIPAEDAAALPFAEPAMALAICRYDLGPGPLRLTAPAGDTFLSLSFMEPGTRIFHGLTDRAALQGNIEVVLATDAQLARINTLDAPDELVQEIRVRSPQVRGMVVVKAFYPFPSQRIEAEELLARAGCESERLPGG